MLSPKSGSCEPLNVSPAFLIDGYWPPLYPRIEYDAELLLGRAKELGCSVVRFPSVGKWATYPSEIMPPHPDLGGRDLIAETIAAARRLDARVVLYLSVGHALPESLVRGYRPDWGALEDDGNLPRPRQFFGGEGVVPLDTFGRYWTDILRMVDELLERYEVAALYLDGPYYGWHYWEGLISQAAGTRETYLRETGRPLPRNADGMTAEVRDFWRWAADKLLMLFQEIRVRAGAAGVPVMFNLCAGKAGCEDISDKLLAFADGCLLERIMGGLNGFAKARRAGCFVWQYASHHTYWPRLSSPTLEADVLFAASETVRYGGRPIYANAGRFAYSMPGAGLRQAFQLLGEQSGWIAHASKVVQAAVVLPSEAPSAGHDAGIFRSVPALIDAFDSGSLSAEARFLDALEQKPPIAVFPSSWRLDEIPVSDVEAFAERGGVALFFVGEREGGLSPGIKKLLSLASLRVSEDVSRALALHQFDDHVGVAGGAEYLQDGLHAYDLYLQSDLVPDPMPVGGMPGFQPGGDCEIHGWLVAGTQWKRLTPLVWSRRVGSGCVITVATDLDVILARTGERRVAEFLNSLLHIYLNPTPRVEFVDDSVDLQHTFYRQDKSWLLILSDHLCRGKTSRPLPDFRITLPSGALPKSIRIMPDASGTIADASPGVIHVRGLCIQSHVYLKFEETL